MVFIQSNYFLKEVKYICIDKNINLLSHTDAMDAMAYTN